MAIITLTDQEQADLDAAYQRASLFQLAAQTQQLTGGVQGDLIRVAAECQSKLAAGGQPAVAADLARTRGATIATSLGRITDANFPAVQAAAQAVFGITPDQSTVLRKVLAAGVARLTGTAVDGSTIAQDAADLVAAFTAPPLLW